MKNIILSSNFFMNEHATNETLAKIEGLTPSSKIVIINNAQPEYGITTVDGFKNLGQRDVVEMTVSVENLEAQTEAVKEADIVVLTGGDPYPLLHALNETNILEHVKEDVTLIGVSAGAMVLGSSLVFLNVLAPELYQEQNENCLNLLNGAAVIPHCDEEAYFSKENLEAVLTKGEFQFILIDQFDREISLKNLNVLSLKNHFAKLEKAMKLAKYMGYNVDVSIRNETGEKEDDKRLYQNVAISFKKDDHIITISSNNDWGHATGRILVSLQSKDEKKNAFGNPSNLYANYPASFCRYAKLKDGDVLAKVETLLWEKN